MVTTHNSHGHSTAGTCGIATSDTNKASQHFLPFRALSLTHDPIPHLTASHVCPHPKRVVFTLIHLISGSNQLNSPKFNANISTIYLTISVAFKPPSLGSSSDQLRPTTTSFSLPPLSPPHKPTGRLRITPNRSPQSMLAPPSHCKIQWGTHQLNSARPLLFMTETALTVTEVEPDVPGK